MSINFSLYSPKTTDDAYSAPDSTTPDNQSKDDEEYEQSEDQKECDNDEEDITNEGYLMQQSLYHCFRRL